jgi:leader peptidase (prepilin peptidase)/N-methyltransferase
MSISWILYGISFIFGTLVGSFLNVCILRIPVGESVVSPRSHCRHCGRLVRAYDNIPLLSYLLLKGRCRDCGEPISPQYGIVELLSGLLPLPASGNSICLGSRPFGS